MRPYRVQKKKEISYSAVYLHFSQWSHDGSLKKVWQQSILTIQDDLNLSELNLDGTHSLTKKGGQSVAYQGRKKGQTSNILPIMDAKGYVVASTGIIAGNHNDAFNLKSHLQTAFKEMKQLGLAIQGAYFNADMAFDTANASTQVLTFRQTSSVKRSPFYALNGRKDLWVTTTSIIGSRKRRTIRSIWY